MRPSGSVERAQGVLAGGCDSPVRSAWSVAAPMFVQGSADGAYAYDEEGRRFIDYVMAYGPLLFGHTHPALVGGLDSLARHGFVWGCDAPRRSSPRRTNSRASFLDATPAVRHQRNRSNDECYPRRTRVYEAPIAF